MLHETSIPVGDVDEQELEDLVHQLAKVSGQKIEISRVIVIATDSTDLSVMLDSLADTIRSGDHPLEKVERKKPKKKRVGQQSAVSSQQSAVRVKVRRGAGRM